MAFRALSLHSARVDGVSSTSAFHYSFSPSPPPISPVTSNTIVVVLWRRTPLTARKLLDHRGTSSWRQHCAVIPSMQSRTAASTSLCSMTCARWFSSRGGRIVSNSSLRTKMIRCSSAAYVPTLSLSNHFFFFYLSVNLQQTSNFTGKWAVVNLKLESEWWIFPVLSPNSRPKVCERNPWEMNIV